jgi:N utilization substance protein B
MANRHLSRSIVMQSLFELDFTNQPLERLHEILARNGEEFAPGISDRTFIEDLAKRVLEKRPQLDEIIEKAAPEWPIAQIAPVDRTILRIGLYELLFTDRSEVPAKVAINEAIELAKTFGGETSGKFVNGVLGTVYKEIGEPGKDESTKKKSKKKVELSAAEREKLPLEKLGGAVVYAKDAGDTYIALVHDIFGFWTLPKGHIESGMSEESGTAKEVTDEIGVPVKIEEAIGANEYVASDPEKGKIRKRVSYFVAASPKQELNLKESGGLDDVRWFSLREVGDLDMYDDVRPLVAKAVEIISKK